MCNTLSIPEKFALAQRIVVSYYPLLSSFYSMCNFQSVNSSRITIRLNTKIGAVPVIEYNPAFINSLSEKTVAMLISIELFRLILHHPTTRLMYPISLCYRASNIICSDKRILRYCIEDPEIKDCFPTVDEIMELEPTFDTNKDFTLEKIFTILNRERLNGMADDNDDDTDSGSSGGGNSENPETGKEQENPEISSPETQDSQDETGKEEGKEEDREDKMDGEDNTVPNEIESLKKHFSKENIETNTEAWGENDLIDRKITKQIEREYEKKDSWGDLPENMCELIRIANTFVYDPRAIFSKFSTSVFSDVMEFTRMKPPRRLGQEYIGIIPGQRHDTMASVLIGLDSSGSMTDEELTLGLGFMTASLQHAEVHFCWWDCACSDITLELTPKQEYKISGGGGTNPQCIIDKIRKEKLYFDGIVVISDCVFNWKNPGGQEKICIVETSKANAPEWCKWHFKLKDLLKRI